MHHYIVTVGGASFVAVSALATTLPADMTSQGNYE